MTHSVSHSFAIPLSHFDNNGRLKPNWAFWVSVLFLLRSYAVLVAALSFRQDSSALLSLFYPQQASLYQSLLSGIPVIVAVGCVSFREAIAKKSVSWPFQLVIPLLVAGIIGDIVHYALVAADMHWRFSWAAAIAFTGNVIVALYVIRSRLLRAFVDDWRDYSQSTNYSQNTNNAQTGDELSEQSEIQKTDERASTARKEMNKEN